VQRFTVVLPRIRKVAVYVARQTFASSWERGRGDDGVNAGCPVNGTGLAFNLSAF
jgi:hypothetical protein